MSLKGSRCPKHPSHPMVGVCAFCLTERLSQLPTAECSVDSTLKLAQSSNNNNNLSLPKALSASSIIFRNGHHDLGVEQRHRAYHDLVIDRGQKPCNGPDSVLDHGMVVSDDPMEVSGTTTGRNSFSTTAMDVSTTGRHSFSASTGRHSFSAATALRPNAAMAMAAGGGNGIYGQGDPRMCIIENNMNGHTDIKLISCDNTKNGYFKVPQSSTKLPLVEHVKLAPIETRVTSSASFESHRSSYSGARPEMAKFTEDDGSPNHSQKKMTLSSLFTLTDGSQRSEMKNPQSIYGPSSSSQNSAQFRPKSSYDHWRLRNDSFSEKVESNNTYLFPVPEATKSSSSSWFASLFRRRKKSQWPKSAVNTGWENGRKSWDAPRPSAWEQLRFSSFEGGRSSWETSRRSWEPSRPSWDGVMRTSDADSVLNGIDFANSDVVMKSSDMEPERRSCRDQGGDLANGIADARKFAESRFTLSRSMSAVQKVPHLDEKDKGRASQSSKSAQTQRDVSTQTTPPRASDATEMFIQQRLEYYHRRHRQCSKASSALWSKVWTKTFSNSKWTFKHKHQRARAPKEQTDGATSMDDFHEPCCIASGRSSFHESDNPQCTNKHLNYNANAMEHDAYDTCFNRGEKRDNLVSNDLKVVPQHKIVAFRNDMARDDCEEKNRNSSINLESGMLRYYMTPGRRRQGIQGTVAT